MIKKNKWIQNLKKIENGFISRPIPISVHIICHHHLIKAKKGNLNVFYYDLYNHF